MNHLLTHDGLQEIPLKNIDFSWLTDGLISKMTMANILGMVLQLLFHFIETVHLSMFTSVQQAVTPSYRVLYFSQGQKTINIYTGSKYAFGIAHDFGVLQCSFLPSGGNKI